MLGDAPAGLPRDCHNITFYYQYYNKQEGQEMWLLTECLLNRNHSYYITSNIAISICLLYMLATVIVSSNHEYNYLDNILEYDYFAYWTNVLKYIRV